MQPIQFDQANKILHGEEGSSVAPLPVCAENGVITSVWKPTLRERELLKHGGLLVLQVMGNSQTQPPVSLGVIPGPKKPPKMSNATVEKKLARKANPKKDAKRARRQEREKGAVK